jgi:hypothetical protein
MTKKRKSSQTGVLNEGMTEPQRATQSTNAANQSMSVTLVSTARQSPNSQHTPNSLVNPHLMHVRIISAFAAKLGALVEWRKIELGDGRTGYALFFDEKKWLVDPVTKELTPLG